jgi:CrcB protein
MERFLWRCRAAVHVPSFSPNLRLALTVGFTGGLTTYSSFAYETTKLLQDGARGGALVNLGVMTVACFVAVLLGLAVADAFSQV